MPALRRRRRMNCRHSSAHARCSPPYVARMARCTQPRRLRAPPAAAFCAMMPKLTEFFAPLSHCHSSSATVLAINARAPLLIDDFLLNKICNGLVALQIGVVARRREAVCFRQSALRAALRIPYRQVFRAQAHTRATFHKSALPCFKCY